MSLKVKVIWLLCTSACSVPVAVSMLGALSLLDPARLNDTTMLPGADERSCTRGRAMPTRSDKAKVSAALKSF